MTTIVRKNISSFEILVDACKNRTFTQEELKAVYNNCDFAFFEKWGITCLGDIVCVLLKNKTQEIEIETITNKYGTPCVYLSKKGGLIITSGRFLTTEEIANLPKTKEQVVVLETIPVGKLWESNTKFNSINPIDKLEVNLNIGDKIQIVECDSIEEQFEVTNNSTMTIKGNITEITGTTRDKEGNMISPGYHIVTNYCVEHADINGEHYKTFTDIGGKWLKVNGETICHLSNGFGDGNYTMRFSKGFLVR